MQSQMQRQMQRHTEQRQQSASSGSSAVSPQCVQRGEQQPPTPDSVVNLKRRVAGLQAEVAAARFGELGAARAVAAAAELGIAGRVRPEARQKAPWA